MEAILATAAESIKTLVTALQLFLWASVSTNRKLYINSTKLRENDNENVLSFNFPIFKRITF